MFETIREELAAIEYLIAGIGEQPVSQKNVGNYVDSYCEVKDLAKRLKVLEMDIGDALRNNFQGNLVTPTHKITITKPSASTTTTWRKVADELQNFVDPNLYAKVVNHNSKQGTKRPSIRVEV